MIHTGFVDSHIVVVDSHILVVDSHIVVVDSHSVSLCPQFCMMVHSVLVYVTVTMYLVETR